MKKNILNFFFLSLGFAAQAQVASNVTLLGQYDNNDIPTTSSGQTFNDIWGYAAKGREYAIMGSAALVHFIDVTDPANYVVIEEFPGGDTTTWRDMKTYQNWAYAASDFSNEGLLIFDLSDLPNSVPMVLQTTEFFKSAHNIFIDETHGRLYACGTDSAKEGLVVLDIATNPNNPILLANTLLPNAGGYIHDLYVKDHIVYASSGNEGFFVLDFTDPKNPVLLASTSTNGYNHSSWVSEDGSFAIFAEEVPRGLPLGIIDLSNLEMGSIEVENYFRFPLIPDDTIGNTPHNPFIRDHYAYVSYYEDGVHIYDVSDPKNPTRVGWYDTFPNNQRYVGYFGCWGVYPFLPSGRILASDRKYGLHILEFHAPTDDFENVEGFIFPNPSDGFLQIKIDPPLNVVPFEFELIDLSGRILEKRTLTSAYTSVDVTHLPAGFYVGKIIVGGKEFLEKLVIR